jgi:anti-sigma factor ChrR (cupin superfamily)
MEDSGVNEDFSAVAVVNTAEVEWQASPSPTVWRKRLELSGPREAGRVTSVVRYDPDSRFHEHPHPDGEEIFVLEGIFSDEHGDFPAGTFLLNPEGFVHAPFSREGCVLFVKLRQYPGTDRRHVVVDTTTAPWLDTPAPGITYQELYGETGHPERIVHVRMAPDTKSPVHDHPGGEEVYVLEGSCYDKFGHYGTGTWVRFPSGSRHRFETDEGCRLYVKSGHLSDA